MNKYRVVCDCYGITVKDIEDAINKGAICFEDLESSMHLGVLCGACIGDAKKVINEIIKNKN